MITFTNDYYCIYLSSGKSELHTFSLSHICILGNSEAVYNFYDFLGNSPFYSL